MQKTLTVDETLDRYKDRQTDSLIFGDNGFTFLVYIDSIFIDDGYLTTRNDKMFGKTDNRIVKLLVEMSIATMVKKHDEGARMEFKSPEACVVACAIIHRHFKEMEHLINEMPSAKIPIEDLRMMENFYHHYYEQLKANFIKQWASGSDHVLKIRTSADLINFNKPKKDDPAEREVPLAVLKALEEVSVSYLEKLMRKPNVNRLGGIR